MAIVICALCFKRKEGMSVFPHTEAVCRGCFLDLDRATGWLESQGWGLVHGASGLILGLEGVQVAIDPEVRPGRPSLAEDDPPNPPEEPNEAPVAIPPKAKAK